MAKILCCFVALYINYANGQATRLEPPGQLESLEWLVGSWQRTNVKAGMTANEKWNMDTPGELIGLGVTMRGNDTVFVEKMRILQNKNNFYYVADVKENAAPVYFKIIAMTESGFTCENPEHDFPKKIEYKIDGETLAVTISAGTKSQKFSFVKK